MILDITIWGGGTENPLNIHFAMGPATSGRLMMTPTGPPAEYPR